MILEASFKNLYIFICNKYTVLCCTKFLNLLQQSYCNIVCDNHLANNLLKKAILIKIKRFA